ncbi:hypothetical protein GALMADRAFT_235173 [Galerina marginata CBS 339.88]|uniref:F-box domain-containing protein n=1 Tax=Galerina marginata (strain CBS 339.88) TaxID=685588 RepID=A0A067U141_GALM3|nr:hypothetical protein GALMADRAFT_235173 [Galerina marginata CBS 339.88]
MYRCTQCGNLDTTDNEEPFKTCQLADGERCEACQKLYVLDVQISEAKTFLENLLYRRRELKFEVNRLHDPIIYRMPLEVVTKIFDIYANSWELPGAESVNHSPFTLGAVCQIWRHIVWSTPQLWTCIAMDLSVNSQRDTEKYNSRVQVLSKHIDLSGNRPLRIALCAPKEVSTQYVSSIIDIINKCSRRWRRLDLKLPEWLIPLFTGHVDEPNVESCKGNAAPVLEELCIHNTSEDYEDPSFSLAGSGNVPGAKPAPIIVDFRSLRVRLINLEWNKVTHVTLDGEVFMDDVLVLLQCTPQLIECKISETYGWEDNAPDVNSMSPLIHPSLQRLDISLGDCIVDIFSIITLPALERLKCDFQNYAMSADPFTSFLTRSHSRSSLSTSGSDVNTQLKALWLLGVNFLEGPSPLIQICQATPALVDFRLEKVSLIPSGLSPPPCEPPLLGLLQVLSNERSLSTAMATGRQYVGEATGLAANFDPPNGVTETPPLLPFLEILKMTIKFDCFFPWELIPGIFLPFDASTPSQRRPLNTVDISCVRSSALYPPKLYVRPETVALFRELRKQGVDLKVREESPIVSVDLLDRDYIARAPGL